LMIDMRALMLAGMLCCCTVSRTAGSQMLPDQTASTSRPSCPRQALQALASRRSLKRSCRTVPANCPTASTGRPPAWTAGRAGEGAGVGLADCRA
jgi:hypothetical protein